MQTFLPYASFRDSARCLDNKRLGKQRVETKQLLLALGVPVGEHKPKRSSWVNHPACRMWKRHELSLTIYGQAVCKEWRRRGYKDSLLDQFTAAFEWLEALRYCSDEQRFLYGVESLPTTPNWLGYDRLHASHRSNLLRKDAAHYGQFGWQETADLPYWWPTQQEAVA